MKYLHTTLAALLMFILVGSTPLLSHAFEGGETAEPQAVSTKIYLPMIAGRPAETQPTPQPGTLPAALVGTWFTGSIPPTDFYDPTTGAWRDTNGLGQMYEFTSDGKFTYAGFLRIQNGQCRSEVSTYRTGTAKATATAITVVAQTAVTRTRIICGSTSESTTEGPFTPVTIGWEVKANTVGHLQLFVSEGSQTTAYYKKGMPEAMVGSWSLNGVASASFYNPATGAWATPAEDGAWFQFNADGTYRFGEYGHGENEQGCAMTYWVYQEGTATVSGGQLAYQAQRGRVRSENACDPSATSDRAYVDPKLYEFTWEIHNQNGGQVLAISPLGQFNYLVFERE